MQCSWVCRPICIANACLSRLNRFSSVEAYILSVYFTNYELNFIRNKLHIIDKAQLLSKDRETRIIYRYIHI